MLCCHQPTAVSVAQTDEADLPPCHRRQSEKQANHSDKALTNPCDHLHEVKPLAEPQRANTETQPRIWLAVSSIQFLSASFVSVPTARLARTTTAHSPPLREHNLPLRI